MLFFCLFAHYYIIHILSYLYLCSLSSIQLFPPHLYGPSATLCPFYIVEQSLSPMSSFLRTTAAQVISDFGKFITYIFSGKHCCDGPRAS